MSYRPPPEVIERYAQVLVNFALGNGRGMQAGETVYVLGEEVTKPLLAEVARTVWRAGGNVLAELQPAADSPYNFRRIFFEEASDKQLDFFAAKYVRGRLDEADHLVYVSGSTDPKALGEIDPQKLLRHQAAQMPAIQWQQEQERAGRFHWTVGLWGTEAMADEAGLNVERYWDQIIRACFLDDAEPIERWREVSAQIASYRDWLNSLEIDRLHLEADGTDLWLTLGESRRWVGGGGRNIPSFEIFTSPDWRGTEGRVRFTEPLYVFGSLTRGVELEFRDGIVVDVSATENAELVQQIVDAEGGNKVGEFSLTDARLSRIDRFMASTLYDENVGGPYGNTHVAIGLSLTDTYDGDAAAVSDQEWERLGYNNSAAVHTDIVATSDRTVTATLRDGSAQVIYADGNFQLH